MKKFQGHEIVLLVIHDAHQFLEIVFGLRFHRRLVRLDDIFVHMLVLWIVIRILISSTYYAFQCARQDQRICAICEYPDLTLVTFQGSIGTAAQFFS